VIVLGLTGSIGMGKSVTANMLVTLKIPVHEADAEVHDLLEPEGKGAIAVGAAFPFFQYPEIYGPKNKSGVRAIQREALGRVIFRDDEKRLKLEEILHPLVREAQTDFIRKNKIMGVKIAALDIPLLFETGGENFVDYTLVVTAPYEVQRRRVMERPGMTEEKFTAILRRQMPDSEKCARADYIIHTGIGRAQSMKELKAAISDIRKKEKKKNDKESPRPLSRRTGKSRNLRDDF
jgi:dephospho-CoA kinase